MSDWKYERTVELLVSTESQFLYALRRIAALEARVAELETPVVDAFEVWLRRHPDLFIDSVTR